MRSKSFVALTILLLLCGTLTLSVSPTHAQLQSALPWAAEPFRVQWQRTDRLVAEGKADYSWYWGPAPRSLPLLERNDDAPGGKRLVLYYDKGRMEVPLTGAAAPRTNQLTFGRLVYEMVTGNMQLGNQRFEPGRGAIIPVVGDMEDALAPTYASFNGLISAGPVPRASGSRPAQLLDRNGVLTNRPDLAAAYPEAAFSDYDAQTGHNIPRVFSAFMQRSGPVELPDGKRVVEQVIDPLALIGRPLTEPYWADTEINGRVQTVLLQLFERRVLSYNPANPRQFQVELGNTGMHYYEWRYGSVQPRASRIEQLFSHFENGEQALGGGYWFSFDDRSIGGSSSASNRLITPGADNSVRAMRFDFNVTNAIETPFAALAAGLGPNNATVDLRGVSAIGFWARGSNTQMSLRLGSAFTDAPFASTFIAPPDWTYIEIPISSLRQEPGRQTMDIEQALPAATRLEFRPATGPSAGFVDLDTIEFIHGEAKPTTQPGLPLIDNFDDGNLIAAIDKEWFTYTDRDSGGGSIAELAVVTPGANGKGGALRFRGGFNKQWAKTPFLGMGLPLDLGGQPLDLSGYRGIQLNIKTDGHAYRLQFSSKLIKDDAQYGIALVAPEGEWTPLYIPFTLFTADTKEGTGVPMQLAMTQVENLIITPLDQPEAFQVLIDDVTLVK